MEFSVSARSIDATIAAIGVHGEIDAFTAPKLKQEIIRQMEGGIVRLAIDLSEVNYIDSAGLGALIGGLTRIRDRGGRLALICPVPRITRIFEITGLNRIFDLVSDEASAVERLRGGL